MSDQQELAVRVCTQCGATKHLEEYYTNSQMRGGRQKQCKVCVRANIKAARLRNRDYYLAFDKKRANLPHRVAARREYQHTEAGKAAFYRATLKQIERHPHKVRARDILNKAVKSGKVTKQSCEVCGDPRVDGHHDDYSKPLEVRWLCLLHHKQVHGYMMEKTA